MSKVVDVRNAGGSLVILGTALTLPSSTNGPQGVAPGSMRYNPEISVIEILLGNDPTMLSWVPLGSGNSDTPPPTPQGYLANPVFVPSAFAPQGQPGQLWFDDTAKTLAVFDGSWEHLATQDWVTSGQGLFDGIHATDIPTQSPSVSGKLWSNNGALMISTNSSSSSSSGTPGGGSGYFSLFDIVPHLPLFDPQIPGALWLNSSTFMVSVATPSPDAPQLISDLFGTIVANLNTADPFISGQVWIDSGLVMASSVTEVTTGSLIVLISGLPFYDPVAYGALWVNSNVLMVSSGVAT